MMKKPLFVVLIICASTVKLATAQVEIPTDDFQVRIGTTLEFPLYKDKNQKELINGIVIANIRATDNASRLADRRLGFAFKFKGLKNLTIQPSYLYRNVGEAGITLHEHRLRLDITPKISFKHFSIENRSRLEQRIRTEGLRDATFYRNRTKIKIPVNREGETRFSPYAANDTFFDLRRTRVHRNDTVGGISRKFTKNFTADFFYQYRRNFQSVVEQVHSVGVNLKFKVN
ncbi:MAG: DUF2490 domain-containing protein [Pyrinomonadaceae bacterium]|nr:DUF2490 domain-containing protein [Pyrinomonadaceae bacterium]